eukprot:4193203-Pyramimonas_sp.AAC.1
MSTSQGLLLKKSEICSVKVSSEKTEFNCFSALLSFDSSDMAAHPASTVLFDAHGLESTICVAVFLASARTADHPDRVFFNSLKVTSMKAKDQRALTYILSDLIGPGQTR